MKLLLFHPSAAASGDMTMASLPDLGAELQAVRQAVESVDCRAAVSSDRSFQSSRRCAAQKGLEESSPSPAHHGRRREVCMA